MNKLPAQGGGKRKHLQEDKRNKDVHDWEGITEDEKVEGKER